MTTNDRSPAIMALVADDDASARRKLLRALTAVWPELKLIEAANGIDAWDAFLEHEPELCFLDVRMPGLTGIEVAQRIADRAQIIFLTAANDRALPTFAAGSVLHLIKPLDPQRIAEAVAQSQAAMAPERQALLPSLQHLLDQLAGQLRRPAPLRVIETGEGPLTQWLEVDDIVYLEADSRGTRVVSSASETLVRRPLKELVAELDPHIFLQVNRFAVVNRQHILATRRIEDGTMVLSLRERAKTLAVSRHFQPTFGTGGGQPGHH